MTFTAIVFMSTSVLAVTVLAGWCFWMVLKPRVDGEGAKKREADRN
ncbi:MAG: hypothetical protein MUP90_11620 [Gammaproteobacteria bacterium]|nr:hypothetical protein [Gammaproteobacteria bacterium]